jgi:hypothetical protein
MGSPGAGREGRLRHGHRPILTDRLRRLPGSDGIGFSWIDRRLVREGHLARLTPEAATLYFFLVTVADRDGVSYYGEAKVAERTGLDRGRVFEFVRELVRADLVAYRHPVYQVLSLPAPCPGATPPSPLSLGQILRHMAREAGHGDGTLARDPTASLPRADPEEGDRAKVVRGHQDRPPGGSHEGAARGPAA